MGVLIAGWESLERRGRGRRLVVGSVLVLDLVEDIDRKATHKVVETLVVADATNARNGGNGPDNVVGEVLVLVVVQELLESEDQLVNRFFFFF